MKASLGFCLVLPEPHELRILEAITVSSQGIVVAGHHKPPRLVLIVEKAPPGLLHLSLPSQVPEDVRKDQVDSPVCWHNIQWLGCVGFNWLHNLPDHDDLVDIAVTEFFLAEIHNYSLGSNVECMTSAIVITL